MPANNATRCRNGLAHQDRLEREARTQALARHGVSLSGNDFCRNAAEGSRPRYHQRSRTPDPYTTAYRHSSSPPTQMGYPHTCTASNRQPRSSSPAPWGDPIGQASRQREMEDWWLQPLGSNPPPQSQRELTDAEYDVLWDNARPQPAAGDSTEIVEALLLLGTPPSSTLVGPPSRPPSPAYDPTSLFASPRLPSTCAYRHRQSPLVPPTPPPTNTPIASIRPPFHAPPEIAAILHEEPVTKLSSSEWFATTGVRLEAAGLAESRHFQAMLRNRQAYSALPEDGKIEFTDMLLADMADMSFKRTLERGMMRCARTLLEETDAKVRRLERLLSELKAEATCAICMELA